MSIINFIILIDIALISISFLCIIFARNLIISTFALVAFVFSIIILFPFIYAEYLFAIFLMVYLGAIVVFFMFVVMLLNIRDINHLNKKQSFFIFALFCIVFFLICSYCIITTFYTLNFNCIIFFPINVSQSFTNAESIGLCLINEFGFVLVVAGILMFFVILAVFLIIKKKNV